VLELKTALETAWLVEEYHCDGDPRREAGDRVAAVGDEGGTKIRPLFLFTSISVFSFRCSYFTTSSMHCLPDIVQSLPCLELLLHGLLQSLPGLELLLHGLVHSLPGLELLLHGIALFLHGFEPLLDDLALLLHGLELLPLLFHTSCTCTREESG
jgi:hypothetical protein